jgi:hypothetical protein
MMQLTEATRGELADDTGGLAGRELADDTGGLAGRVQRRFAALQKDREKTFALPGYEGDLEITFRRLGVDEVEQVLFDTSIEAMNDRYAQFLLDALVGIYGLEEDGSRSPLEHGRPHAFDDVARMANPAAQPDSARAAVLEVFDGDDHLLRDFGDLIYSWTKRVRAAAEAAVAGG